MPWFLCPTKLLIPVLGVYLSSAICCTSQSHPTVAEDETPGLPDRPPLVHQVDTTAQQTINQEQPLPSVNQEVRIKSQLELTLEAVIKNAYLRCLKDYQIQGKQVTLRMPFAQNDERYEVGEFSQQIFGGGKAEPQDVWERIGSLLQCENFQKYIEALQAPAEKVIFFNLSAGS